MILFQSFPETISSRFVLDSIQQSSHRLTLIVGALIHEIGLNSVCDTVLVVDASDDAIRKQIGDKFGFGS